LTEPGPAPGSGERIGAYEIQGLLGRGGMGEVFLAWDARLRRRVAIKRIRHDHGLNPAMRQRLLREARAVAGLSHPAIVQVYDLLEDATGDCIVLEYVEGRTLAATLIEAGRLEPETAVRLAGEIAGGLAAAHAAISESGSCGRQAVRKPSFTVRTPLSRIGVVRTRGPRR